MWYVLTSSANLWKQWIAQQILGSLGQDLNSFGALISSLVSKILLYWDPRTVGYALLCRVPNVEDSWLMSLAPMIGARRCQCGQKTKPCEEKITSGRKKIWSHMMKGKCYRREGIWEMCDQGFNLLKVRCYSPNV